jgi:hypothetical protein
MIFLVGWICLFWEIDDYASAHPQQIRPPPLEFNIELNKLFTTVTPKVVLFAAPIAIFAGRCWIEA